MVFVGLLFSAALASVPEGCRHENQRQPHVLVIFSPRLAFVIKAPMIRLSNLAVILSSNGRDNFNLRFQLNGKKQKWGRYLRSAITALELSMETWSVVF